MINPVIIGAIIAQRLITRVSRLAGSIAGYVITTGIFLWGLWLYSTGDGIAFLGFPLSQPVFIVAILVWYGFDTIGFLAAKRAQQPETPPKNTTKVIAGRETAQIRAPEHEARPLARQRDPMRTWYYSKSDQQQGPISEDALVKLFESGSLPADTLVWSEGLKDWQEARTIENLVPAKVVPPPLIHAIVPTGPQIRPWVRSWARGLDMLLFSGFAGIILGLIYPPALEINGTLLAIIVYFLYLFIEPGMLALWGTTPGKALFNIRLRKTDGTKLKYPEALSRACSVWVRGIGLGIPIVTIFTQVSAYNRLTKDGITSWDKDGGFRVIHKIIGPGRIIAVIAIEMMIFALIVIGALEAAMEKL